MASSWREFWNRDTPIYVNERHKALHYQAIADDIVALVASPSSHVLDHGCGEALSADRVAARCGKLHLCDAAPLVRDRLSRRFAADPKIAILAPDEVAAIPASSLDLVVANSLAQYLTTDELGACLALWRDKLRPGGGLVLADILPPRLGPIPDTLALLRFAARGGFLPAALLGLARTALSDYSRLRGTLGLARYGEEEMLARLTAAGFRARRLARNLGHNQNRMTFEATVA